MVLADDVCQPGFFPRRPGFSFPYLFRGLYSERRQKPIRSTCHEDPDTPSILDFNRRRRRGCLAWDRREFGY